MEIALHRCTFCGKQKIFWLKHRWEDSFYCTCSHRKLQNYHDASFGDFFTGLVKNPITVDGLVTLAKKHFMRVNRQYLETRLKDYDLKNLNERDFYDVIGIILSSDDVYRLRLVLCQITLIDPFLLIIANVNPRIDIPRLRGYLSGKCLPLSIDRIIEMENVIETNFYHDEVDQVTQWDEIPQVIECFNS